MDYQSMLWLLLLQQKSQFRIPYQHAQSWKCSHCKEELHGWAQVMGAGENMQGAQSSAYNLSMLALARAECPACGALGSSAEAHDVAEQAAASRNKIHSDGSAACRFNPPSMPRGSLWRYRPREIPIA
jgi:hypothetical protein